MIEVTNSAAVWEEKYARGHAQRYPWDAVVSFIFRNAPKDRPRERVRILEVGCGTGANLWFAAREGFTVAGVDASLSAITAAKQRFTQDRLTGTFEVADFGHLPFPDGSFDLVIDRGSLTCAGRSAARRAITEISRVLVPGGRFHFNPYSDHHSSAASGHPGNDGLTLDITEGSMVGSGQICFYSRSDTIAVLAGWDIKSLQHVVFTEDIAPTKLVHAEWRAIAERRA